MFSELLFCIFHSIGLLILNTIRYLHISCAHILRIWRAIKSVTYFYLVPKFCLHSISFIRIIQYLKNPSLDVDDGKLMDVPCSNFLDLEILYSDDYVDVICNWHTLNNVFVTSC